MSDRTQQVQVLLKKISTGSISISESMRLLMRASDDVIAMTYKQLVNGNSRQRQLAKQIVKMQESKTASARATPVRPSALRERELRKRLGGMTVDEIVKARNELLHMKGTSPDLMRAVDDELKNRNGGGFVSTKIDEPAKQEMEVDQDFYDSIAQIKDLPISPDEAMQIIAEISNTAVPPMRPQKPKPEVVTLPHFLKFQKPDKLTLPTLTEPYEWFLQVRGLIFIRDMRTNKILFPHELFDLDQMTRDPSDMGDYKKVKALFEYTKSVCDGIILNVKAMSLEIGKEDDDD